MEIKELLQLAIDRKASDLHLIVGVPPTFRIESVLVPIAKEALLTPEKVEEHLKKIMSPEQVERIAVNKEIDFSLAFSDKSRFRANAYTQRGTLAASFRRIPIEIPTIEDLGLPKILHTFTPLKQGLILVTGPTGHGKSTTLAAVLDEINATRSVHIVTIEDPIEFIFKPKKSIISQREMQKDTLSWTTALRSALREDPDIVMVGEIRDYETMTATMTVAETGHLVFATLHTNSASQAIDRMIDIFPKEQQQQVRLQLSSVLEAVFSMRLIPAIGGGLVVAHEVMLGTTAVKTVIREGKTHQLDNIVQTSQEVGMNSLESSLASLVKAGKIELEMARSYSLRPEELNRLVKGVARKSK